MTSRSEFGAGRGRGGKGLGYDWSSPETSDEEMSTYDINDLWQSSDDLVIPSPPKKIPSPPKKIPSPPPRMYIPPPPQKIYIKSASTQINTDFVGQYGKYIGKTGNNMYILEVKGKNGEPVRRNFWQKDLVIPEKVGGSTSGPKPTKTLSPDSLNAEKFANDFINSLHPNIADKVMNAICKRRTSRTKKTQTRTSPGRKSPSKRKSPTRKCKDTEEISKKTGRCVQKCKPDQERNLATGRCKKRTSGMKTIPSVARYDDDDDDLIETGRPRPSRPSRPSIPPRPPIPSMVADTNDYEPIDPKIRMTRNSPRYQGTPFVGAKDQDEYEDPVTQFVTEEVLEGPFERDYDDDDDLIA